MSDIPFGDTTRCAPLPELPPLPDWFVEHPQVPAHTDHCAVCQRTRLNYETYLRSDAWQIRRQLALEFYGASCCLCGSPNRLQVHHRTYERIGQEQLRDLIVLCDDCHASYHRKAA